MGNEGRREPRVHDAEILGPVPNRVVGIWRIEAAGTVFASSEALSGRFRGMRLTSLADLQRAHRLEDVAACYRRVFGAPETSATGEFIWGEGARCVSCQGLIPLPDFERAAAAAGPVCPLCGEGLLIEVYPIDKVVKTLEDVLMAKDRWTPVVAVMESEGSPISGVMYGAVTDREGAIQRMYEEQSVYPDGPSLERFHQIYGCLPATGILHIDALAVDVESREGVRICQGLVGLTYTRAVELGATGAIAVTNTRSQAYVLMLAHGFEIVGQQADRVYMWLPEIRTVAQVLQNTTPEGTAQTIARSVAALVEEGVLSPFALRDASG